MFQYAQSVLEGLRHLEAAGCRVWVVYVGERWAVELAKYPYEVTHVQHGQLGVKMADFAMAARIPGRLSRVLARYLNPVAREIYRINCDLWIFPAQDALAYQVDLPVVSAVHDLMHRFEPRFPEVSKAGRFGVREHRFSNITHWSQAVLVDSELGRQHVAQAYGVSASKIYPLPYVAPHYVNLAVPTDFDTRYPLPGKFIFYPAQFWAHKNHLRLLEAAASALSSCPDLQLVFTGDKKHGFDEVHDHALSLGVGERVHFPGYVPDVYLTGFYRRARAMVMPTFFGPTNIPPLEAFACGCPTAVSNNYAMPEQARGAALLFDPNSVPEITRAIQQLWLDDALCEVLAERGLENACRWGQKEFGQALCQILITAASSTKTVNTLKSS